MTASDHILSVTELNRRARQLLEVHLSSVWVRGEISNLSIPSSGHWYFTLKDDKAQISCAMFRGNNALLRFRPENGMQVIARGRVSLYEGRGNYQLVVENLTAEGAGNLQIAFEQLKNKLADEQLFNDEFKQPLPTLPHHIGVITSPTGAAIRDIISVFKRRFPAINISIFPVPVQGADAAPAIVNALQLANTQTDIDALIIARGGGSIEDLWAFNEEIVARAVFASEIPIVSAVGHETDFTICDFVADVRAPTPSAAAELLSPDQAELHQLLLRYSRTLQKEMALLVNSARAELLNLTKRLRHPGHTLREQQQTLDHLEWRLQKAFRYQQQLRAQRIENASTRLNRYSPQLQLSTLQVRLELASKNLNDAIQQRYQQRKQTFTHLAALLDTVSPLNTLKRGYAIASDAENHALSSTQQVHTGDTVYVRLSDGQLDCTVQAIQPPLPTS